MPPPRDEAPRSTGGPAKARQFATDIDNRSDTIDKVLGRLLDREFPGGCDICMAFQTIEKVDDGLWIINVRHDDACEVLARYQGRTL